MCYASPTPEQSLDANLRRFLRSCCMNCPRLRAAGGKCSIPLFCDGVRSGTNDDAVLRRTHGCLLPSVPGPFYTSMPLYFSLCVLSRMCRELRVQGRPSQGHGPRGGHHRRHVTLKWLIKSSESEKWNEEGIEIKVDSISPKERDTPPCPTYSIDICSARAWRLTVIARP